MTTTMVQRVAGRHISAASEKQELLWSSDQITKAIRKLEDVYLVLTARGPGSSYEGNESIADGNSVVTRAMQEMQKASESLNEVAETLRSSGALSKRANDINSLTGVDKRTGLRRINAVIAGARLNGIFRDNNWTPVQKLWREFEQAGIPVNLVSANYTKDDQGNPNSKVWKFTVEWDGPTGQHIVTYGQVVASGAGSVRDPLDAYDVVAYVN